MSTPRSIRWAPSRTERGTILYQHREELDFDQSSNGTSEYQPAKLRRHRSLTDLFHNKWTATKEKKNVYNDAKSKNWVINRVKRLVTQFSPTKRRELRQMKSEGALRSSYQHHSVQPTEVIFEQPQLPPLYADIDSCQVAEEVKRKPTPNARRIVCKEPTSRDLKACLRYMKRITERLENTPGTVQWQDRILQKSRSLRRDVPVSGVSAMLIDLALEESLPLRRESAGLATCLWNNELDFLSMPDRVVSLILQDAEEFEDSIPDSEFVVDFFGRGNHLDMEALSGVLFGPDTDIACVQSLSGCTTPSVATRISSDYDEYSATEIATKYQNAHSSKVRTDKESPGIIVMDDIPYYEPDDSITDDDSMVDSRLHSLVGLDDPFMVDENPRERNQESTTGLPLRRIDKKISLVDFFQSQGILKLESTPYKNPSPPTNRHGSTKYVDDANRFAVLANLAEESECSYLSEPMGYQAREDSGSSTEVDCDFGEPLERFPRWKCGNPMCNYQNESNGEGEDNANTYLDSIPGKSVGTHR